MFHERRRISYGSSKLMEFRSPMYTVFWTIEVVLPLIPLILLPKCILALQSLMSDISFPVLVAVFVTRFSPFDSDVSPSSDVFQLR